MKCALCEDCVWVCENHPNRPWGRGQKSAHYNHQFWLLTSFRSYPSLTPRTEGKMDEELPEAGVTYYDVPQEYGVREYRYTVVNDRPVLVDPRTRRIVEVVE
jgi:hypothetical protein